MTSRTQELLREWELRDISREVVRGKPLDGNAWDDYAQAAAKIKAFRAAGGRSLPGDPTLWTSLETARVIVPPLQPALADFRTGTSRRQARFPIVWSRLPDDPMSPIPSLIEITQISSLALAQAALWLDSHRGFHAARLQIDVARYGQDIAVDGVPIAQSIGFNVVNTALEAIHETLRSGQFSSDELLELARELDVLDRTMPRTNGLVQERIYLGFCLSGNGGADAAPAAGGPSWRHAFSSRLLLADLADRLDRRSANLVTAEAAGSREVRKAIEAFQREAHETAAPKLEGYFGAANTLEFVLLLKARLRLLRSGAHWKACGTKLMLQDPFGTTLSCRETPAGLRIWSVGRDGSDQGGVGTFRDGSDVVVDVPR